MIDNLEKNAKLKISPRGVFGLCNGGQAVKDIKKNEKKTINFLLKSQIRKVLEFFGRHVGNWGMGGSTTIVQ